MFSSVVVNTSTWTQNEARISSGDESDTESEGGLLEEKLDDAKEMWASEINVETDKERKRTVWRRANRTPTVAEIQTYGEAFIDKLICDIIDADIDKDMKDTEMRRLNVLVQMSQVDIGENMDDILTTYTFGDEVREAELDRMKEIADKCNVINCASYKEIWNKQVKEFVNELGTSTAPMFEEVVYITGETDDLSIRRLMKAFARCPSHSLCKEAAFDIEYVKDELVCLSITGNKGTLVFDADALKPDSVSLQCLKKLFDNPNLAMFGWGIANDRKFLKKLGLDTTYVIEGQLLCMMKCIEVTSMDNQFNAMFDQNCPLRSHLPRNKRHALRMCSLDSWKTFCVCTTIVDFERQLRVKDYLEDNYGDNTCDLTITEDKILIPEHLDKVPLNHFARKVSNETVKVEQEEEDLSEIATSKIAMLIIVASLPPFSENVEGIEDSRFRIPSCRKPIQIKPTDTILDLYNKLCQKGVCQSIDTSTHHIENISGFIAQCKSSDRIFISAVHTNKKGAKKDVCSRIVVRAALDGHFSNLWHIHDLWNKEKDETNSTIIAETVANDAQGDVLNSVSHAIANRSISTHFDYG